MKAAFSQASLALTVNTLPSVERRQLCYLPPRRSDAEEDLYTDIFSQSQGEFLIYSCIRQNIHSSSWQTEKFNLKDPISINHALCGKRHTRVLSVVVFTNTAGTLYQRIPHGSERLCEEKKVSCQCPFLMTPVHLCKHGKSTGSQLGG